MRNPIIGGNWKMNKGSPSEAIEMLKKLIPLVKKINSVDIAKEYLLGFLYLLKISGYSTLVVAVDEFEYLFSIVTSSQQSIYLAVLRELFDLNVIIPKEFNKISNIAFLRRITFFDTKS